ncbi:MAG: uroporphyrinogen-III synthase [Aquificaceae bacterium]
MAFRIALTRSPEDIQKDRKLFEEAGFEVIPLPLIEEETLEFEVPSFKFDFVIFQSPRAVRLFLSRHRLKDERIVVVGEKTRKALEAFGYKAWAMPKDYYGKEIVGLFKGLEGRVLIPRSAVGRDEVVEGLRVLGLEVYALDVYRVKERLHKREELIKALSKTDVVLFASPSAIKGLLANLQKQEVTRLLEGKKLVCIGKTTGDFLREKLNLEAQLPEKPTMEEVIRLLRSLA